jgi:hypothetical protein
MKTFYLNTYDAAVDSAFRTMTLTRVLECEACATESPKKSSPIQAIETHNAAYDRLHKIKPELSGDDIKNLQILLGVAKFYPFENCNSEQISRIKEAAIHVWNMCGFTYPIDI